MDFDTWWFPRTKRRKTEIEKAEKEEAHIEEAEIEELQDNNQVTDYEESLQIDKIQENDDDHEQSTNTDIKQEQKIEITIGETNVAAQENEDNLTTIEEHTDTKDSLKQQNQNFSEKLKITMIEEVQYRKECNNPYNQKIVYQVV